MTTPSELADELEAQGEGYLRTLKPAWTGTNHDEALALIIVVADNLPTILSALRQVEVMRETLKQIAASPGSYDCEAAYWRCVAARQALTGEA